MATDLLDRKLLFVTGKGGVGKTTIAASLAVVIGLLIGRFRLASQSLMPPLEVLRPIPAVAWIPIAILLFASAEHSMIFITFIGAFFPVLLNTVHGVETLDRRLVSASLSLGAGPLDVFREVILPGALPYILTGLRLGLAQAWRILVVVELLAAVPWGLGWLIFGAREFLNTDVMLAGIAVIGIIGLALEKLVFQRLEEFTVVRWGMMAS